MNEAVEEGGVKEGRRSGSRYKEGDFGDFKGGWSGGKNLERITERKKGEIFGINSMQIFTLSEGGCCSFYWYVGSGARKPVGFLVPTNLLVGMVEKSELEVRILQEQERERQEQ